MSQYLPNFSRNLKGKYNPELGFVSIKAGSDAYLLEDEINELQWIQRDSIANLIKHITNSGCIDIPTPNDPTKKGGLIELGTSKLNAFSINSFDAVFDGFISRVNSSDNNPFIIQLTDPPLMGIRYDLVYLEFWFKELKQYDNVPKFGGFYNDPINYQIIDGRMNLETTQRLQLQWAFRTQTGTKYPDILNNNLTNITLNPQGPNGAASTLYEFSVNADDKHLFEAGEDSATGKQTLGTYNGMVYAIPLFLVRRINSSGYNIKYNEDGGVNYVDNTSIAGRPDDKFSNVIYTDQIINLRKQVLIGEEQLGNVFVTKDDFENYQLYVKEQIKAEVDSLRTDVDALTGLVYNEVDKLEDEITSLKDQLNNEIETKIDTLDTSVNKKITDLETSFNNFVNNKFDSLEDLVNAFSISLSDLQNKFDTKVTSLESTISSLKSELTNVQASLDDIINGGLDPWLDKYGLNVLCNSDRTTSGGNMSDGLEVTIKNISITKYTVLYSGKAPTYLGSLGEYWTNKKNTSFTFYNSGDVNLTVDLYNLTIDNSSTFSNSDTSIMPATKFNGMDGVHINRILKSYDFVQIMPIEQPNCKIGEVFYVEDSTGFTVYNTGEAISAFEWTVIDSRTTDNGGTLKNVFVYDIDLNGPAGSIKTDIFKGTDYKVLISTPKISDLTAYKEGYIGEINYQKVNSTTLAIKNTGEAIGSVKAIVFKGSESTDPSQDTYYAKYGIDLVTADVNSSGANGVNGVEVKTAYTSASDYCVVRTYTGNLGNAGCDWIDKGNTSYFYKNTAADNELSKLYTIKVDNISTYSNANTSINPATTFNAMIGTKVTRNMLDTDFIQIISLDGTDDVGEIFITKQNDGFIVYNTGLAGKRFEWVVVDTRNTANGGSLKNVSVYELQLNGVTGNTIDNAFDITNYQIMVSTPLLPDISVINDDTIASIGDVNVKLNNNTSFTVYNSGKALGSVKVVVFNNNASSSTNEYYVKYGIDLVNTNVVSDANTETTGFEIKTNYTSKSDYCVISTYSGTLGDLGCDWIDKGDTSYFYKSTSALGQSNKLYTIKVDNSSTYSNANTSIYPATNFNGMTGTKITKAMHVDTDFVQIMPLADTKDIGEIFIHLENDGFTVYNTGTSGKAFEWTVVDTRIAGTGGVLKNISTYDANLAGVTGTTVFDSFGISTYQIMLSTPMITDISEINDSTTASIGDISVTINDSNSFTVYNSGKALGKVRTVVFKQG